MLKKIFLLCLFLFGSFLDLAFAEEPLSFREAFARVVKNHPLFQAFRKREEALRFRAAQAARLENPEITFSLEDVFGSGEFGGTRLAETTFEVSQRVPLFGKREKRRKALLAQQEILALARGETQLKLFRETARLFTAALYAQEKLKLYEELVCLSKRLFEVAEAKFLAGKVPEAEKIRAEILVAETELKLKNVRQEFENALLRLARLWSGRPSSALLGDLFRLEDLPAQRIPEEHPRLKRFLAEIKQLQKEIELSRAEALPDLTVSAGLRWYNENDERAYLFGLSLPLPIWNRNQEQIAALRREISAARFDLKAERLVLLREFDRVRSTLLQAREEILTFEQKLLPRAREIYRRNLEAYRLGKEEFLKVLDAQKTLFTLRLARLEAYRRFHELRAEALYLLAMPTKDFL